MLLLWKSKWIPASAGMTSVGGFSRFPVAPYLIDRPSDNPLMPSSEKRNDAIHLIVDDRECRGPMLPAIAACGAFAIEVRRLPVGDYCLDDALLFERKTLPDLAASIKDGRLFDQAVRLANVRFRAALILEGQSRDLAGSGMRIEAIQGALVTIALFIGLPLLRTRHAEDTVRTLQFAAQQRRAAAHGALPRHGHRPKGKAALQAYILQGLPGIGPRRATGLIRRFGSIEAVVAADADALAEVGGIGLAVARKLRWAVEEPRARYGVS
jgi:ERCC4-type nuclease